MSTHFTRSSTFHINIGLIMSILITRTLYIYVYVLCNWEGKILFLIGGSKLFVTRLRLSMKVFALALIKR